MFIKKILFTSLSLTILLTGFSIHAAPQNQNSRMQNTSSTIQTTSKNVEKIISSKSNKTPHSGPNSNKIPGSENISFFLGKQNCNANVFPPNFDPSTQLYKAFISNVPLSVLSSSDLFPRSEDCNCNDQERGSYYFNIIDNRTVQETMCTSTLTSITFVTYSSEEFDLGFAWCSTANTDYYSDDWNLCGTDDGSQMTRFDLNLDDANFGECNDSNEGSIVRDSGSCTTKIDNKTYQCNTCTHEYMCTSGQKVTQDYSVSGCNEVDNSGNGPNNDTADTAEPEE